MQWKKWEAEPSDRFKRWVARLSFTQLTLLLIGYFLFFGIAAVWSGALAWQDWNRGRWWSVIAWLTLWTWIVYLIVSTTRKGLADDRKQTDDRKQIEETFREDV